MKNLHDLVTKKIRLPSPPVIAMRIIDMVRQDHFSFEDIGDIIRTDPALAARILRVANSPYYNLGQKIASIEMALLVLGTNVVKNIALSVVIWSATKQDGNGFDFDLYWRRAVTAAVAADLTSAAVGLNDTDIFVLALLQDIGVLVFFATCPKDYQLVLNGKTATHKPLSEMERHFFGFDHQQLGAVLLESWHLPEEIYVPILFHHNNDKLPEKYRSRIEILKIADSLASVYHGGNSVEKVKMVTGSLNSIFSIQEEAVDRLIDAVSIKSLELFSSLDIPAGSMRPFSLILQEANEELSNLNSFYEQLVVKLRQAKENAEWMAKELF